MITGQESKIIKNLNNLYIIKQFISETNAYCSRVHSLKENIIKNISKEHKGALKKNKKI